MEVTLPIDRGFAAITDLDDGTKRVRVFARRSPSGPTHLFATHSSCPEVVITSTAPFERRGRMLVSTDVVEVLFDSASNRLYLRDPARTGS